ncbi:hypothetical protein [Prosthecobacter sp.]|uniref:hypothetical protein n=1 Tax=Prosthecobacter sp. TaxID=1965333 RepID=UPI003784BA23
MSSFSPPKDVLKFLKTRNVQGTRAILLADQQVEGMAVFNGGDPSLTSGGTFFPSKVSLSIAGRQRSQLLLAKSRIVLNVILSPQPADEIPVQHFPFEVAAWESLEQIHAP